MPCSTFALSGKYFRWLRVSCTIVFISFALQGKSQGHYVGGSFNPNDYFVPPTSGWVFPLYYAYSKANFHNAAGEKTNVIPVSQNPPVNIAMGQNVATHSVIPMVIHFGKGKIFNANWGFLFLPIFNSPNANIAMDYYLGQNLVGSSDININSFGAGDFYLQPIWLTWNKNKLSTSFSYGVWMPTGRFEPNDPENIGLGFWSQNLRVATRYKPTAKTNLVGALTFEINSKQQGVDFKEASHLTFDYGGSYLFDKGHEVGVFGFGTWQTGTDKGAKVDLTADRMFGVGAFGAYWIKPGRLSVLGRIGQNIGIKNRYGGFSVQAGINFLLIKV